MTDVGPLHVAYARDLNLETQPCMSCHATTADLAIDVEAAIEYIALCWNCSADLSEALTQAGGDE